MPRTAMLRSTHEHGPILHFPIRESTGETGWDWPKLTKKQLQRAVPASWKKEWDCHTRFVALSRTLGNRSTAQLRGQNMTSDRDALFAIAQRIAEVENRIGQLRDRVSRLKSEGCDTSQAEQTLQIVSGNLTNLYTRQSVVRRSVWARHSSKAG
jgi:hypothetical protein